METVLVVADDQWVINDVEAGLSDRRINLVTVNNPHKVIEVARQETPDLYLIDLQVGSMGGMALTRLIKAQAHLGLIASSPIILMVDRDADSFIAKRAGADGWVLKPFTAQELRAARDAALAVS